MYLEFIDETLPVSGEVGTADADGARGLGVVQDKGVEIQPNIKETGQNFTLNSASQYLI